MIFLLPPLGDSNLQFEVKSLLRHILSALETGMAAAAEKSTKERLLSVLDDLEVLSR